MSNTLSESPMARCHVAFSIFGASLDSRAISEVLKLQPFHAHSAGDRYLQGAYPTDAWSIKSLLEKTEPLDAHLRWLREKLEPHSEYLRSLAGKAELRVYIGFTFRCEQNGFSVSPENLRFFTELNIAMEVTILCGPDASTGGSYDPG